MWQYCFLAVYFYGEELVEMDTTRESIWEVYRDPPCRQEYLVSWPGVANGSQWICIVYDCWELLFDGQLPCFRGTQEKRIKREQVVVKSPAWVHVHYEEFLSTKWTIYFCSLAKRCSRKMNRSPNIQVKKKNSILIKIFFKTALCARYSPFSDLGRFHYIAFLPME